MSAYLASAEATRCGDLRLDVRRCASCGGRVVVCAVVSEPDSAANMPIVCPATTPSPENETPRSFPPFAAPPPIVSAR
jgi:hypothetical protein